MNRPSVMLPNCRAARARALVAAASVAITQTALAAGTFGVSNTSDAGTGSLRQAILDANAAGGGTININVGVSTISLQHLLPILSTPITINGNNADVSGVGVYRVFFSDGPSGSTTTINQLTIRDGRALGGAGGLGGGGGGLGAGAGLFVGRGNVVLNNVNFSNNSAKGGDGGGSGPWSANSVNGGAGGGGLGGSGGAMKDQTADGGGGGGLYGAGQATQAVFDGGHGGGSAPDGSGTEGGVAGVNVGGNGQRYGGGGGSGIGGTGGPFGGGGGGYSFGGNGGFGAGGGSGGNGHFTTHDSGGTGGNGGYGGFGGGGGGGGLGGYYGPGGPTNASGIAGLGGAFAGFGGAPPSYQTYMDSLQQFEGGGGGAALGANVFVAIGANVSFNDVTLGAGTLTPGARGASIGADGSTAGTSLFLSGPTRFGASTGQTRSFNGSIVDVGDYVDAPTAFGYSLATFTKTGDGTIILQANNDYRAGTIISQGNLVAQTAGALGRGAVTINDESTGASNTTLTIGNDSAGFALAAPITVKNLGTGVVSLASSDVTGGSAAFTGPIALERSVTLLGKNNTPQDNLDSTGQTRFDGAITGAGGVTIAGGHMVQFRGANTYSGPTHITGNATLSIYTPASSSPNSGVTVDAGSTLKLEGVIGAAILSLDGAGTILGGNAGVSRMQLGSTQTAATHTFTGSIPETSYTLQLEKVGTDTFVIGAQNNRKLTLTVTSGVIRAAGDLHVYELDCDQPADGRQSFDLAGHLVDVTQYTIPPSIVGDVLNADVGDASDGIYDSANTDTRKAVGVAKSLTTNLYTVKTTWKGDANLDGAVNFNDLVILAQNYNSTTTNASWSRADFNRDGKVDFADLVPLAQNYGLTSLGDDVGDASTFAADWALAQSLVPEPTTGVIACGLLLALRDRRPAVLRAGHSMTRPLELPDATPVDRLTPGVVLRSLS